MPKVKVDEIQVEVRTGTTALQAFEPAGKEVHVSAIARAGSSIRRGRTLEAAE